MLPITEVTQVSYYQQKNAEAGRVGSLVNWDTRLFTFCNVASGLRDSNRSPRQMGDTCLGQPVRAVCFSYKHTLRRLILGGAPPIDGLWGSLRIGCLFCGLLTGELSSTNLLEWVIARLSQQAVINPYHTRHLFSMSGPQGFLVYENPPGAIKGHPEGYPLKGSSVIIILMLDIDNDRYGYNR